MYEREIIARLAQSAEGKALNLVVVGSSPTVGVFAVKNYYEFFFLEELGLGCSIIFRDPLALSAQAVLFTRTYTLRFCWFPGLARFT